MRTDQETCNRATVSRFYDAMNTGDPEIISETIDELVEPHAVIRTPLPIEAAGAQALKEVFGRLHRIYPDLRVTAEDLIAAGDKVVRRNSVTGTHEGDYMGSSTNRQIRHVQRDLRRPLRGRPHRRDLGSRRRLIAAATARCHFRRLLMTNPLQNQRGGRDSRVVAAGRRRCTADRRLRFEN